MKPRKLPVRLFQLWLAARLGVWLCVLPVLLRLHTLPVLLHRLTPVRGQRKSKSPLELNQAVRVVVRLCQLPLFRWRVFPRACLRQALTLYRVLIRMGYPVAIHFGVQKDEQVLHGHSWVTIGGKPVAERTRTEIFTIVYSYPSASFRSPYETKKY